MKAALTEREIAERFGRVDHRYLVPNALYDHDHRWGAERRWRPRGGSWDWYTARLAEDALTPSISTANLSDFLTREFQRNLLDRFLAEESVVFQGLPFRGSKKP